MWKFKTPKLITLEAKDLSGGLSSSKIVLEMLSLKSVVQVCKRNMADAIHLVTALYLILIAQAQSTFLTAFEKVRQIIGCCCLVSISYEERDFSS